MVARADVTLNAGPVALSGRFAAPDGSSKALVVALHGGSYTSRYFDCTAAPDLSLLAVGASLGCAVLALDRPGYAKAAELPDACLGFEGQLEILGAALEEAWARFGSHAGGGAGGMLLVGHSIGGELAYLLAAERPPASLIGVSVGGVGFARRETYDGRAPALAAQASRSITLPPEARRAMMYGPPWTYAPEVFDDDVAHQVPCPMVEYLDARAWPERVRAAPPVTVPVQWVVPEMDGIFDSSPTSIGEIRSFLAGAPAADVFVQYGAGHCLDLARTALAYHLKVLAFAEECLVRRSCVR